MNSLFIARVSLLAGEALLASTLLPALAWSVSLLFSKHAAMRHLMWLAAFVGLLLLPVLALTVPSQLVFELAAFRLLSRRQCQVFSR